MNRLLVLASAITLAACGNTGLNTSHSSAPDTAEPANTVLLSAPRPNVIIIMADDLGWGDIGANGSEIITTPHIDSLADEGVNFTSGYVAAAVCAPSRAALMTGRYQQSFGYEFNPRLRRELGIPVDIETIADRMGALGYSSALIGKWHLGQVPEHHPLNRGFDYFYGFTAGGNGYLNSAEDGEYLSDPVEGSAPGFRRMRLEAGFERIEPEGDLTSLLTEAAVEFIEAEAGDPDPFFLVLTHFAPHTPLQATHSQLERYSHIEDQSTRIYSAMVSAMDDGIGAVIDALERTGARENTLIVFMSDNGCAAYIGEGVCSNGPLAGYKASYFEGGIRVPMIASYPGSLPSGVVFDAPVMSFDWTVTALAMAGGDITGQQFDGVDLRPYLAGTAVGVPHTRLHWRTLPNFTIRDGDMKLVMIEQAADKVMKPLLFDLANDPGETRNLAGARPEEVERLAGLFAEWNATIPEPGWESQRTGTFQLPDGVRVNVYN